jgi:hypothetical protein
MLHRLLKVSLLCGSRRHPKIQSFIAAKSASSSTQNKKNMIPISTQHVRAISPDPRLRFVSPMYAAIFLPFAFLLFPSKPAAGEIASTLPAEQTRPFA